jgi:hypothetical protein
MQFHSSSGCGKGDFAMSTLVFCYGSNLDDAQMLMRCPGRAKVGNAVLRGHRLTFPRLSPRRGCGVSSVEPADGHDVWGVVHRLDAADLAALDAYECFEPGGSAELNRYNRVARVVEIDGVATEVDTYVAVPTANPPAPDAHYLGQIRDGARLHALPEAYQAWLAGLRF